MRITDMGYYGLYALLKLLAYVAWCYFGIVNRPLPYRPVIAWALLFGVLRVLMGILFGTAIGLLLLASNSLFGGPVGEYFSYLFAYIPIRWIEWSLLEAIMYKGVRAPKPFFLGADGKSRVFRIGGIVISCLADGMLMFGFGGLMPSFRIC